MRATHVVMMMLVTAIAMGAAVGVIAAQTRPASQPTTATTATTAKFGRPYLIGKWSGRFSAVEARDPNDVWDFRKDGTAVMTAPRSLPAPPPAMRWSVAEKTLTISHVNANGKRVDDEFQATVVDADNMVLLSKDFGATVPFKRLKPPATTTATTRQSMPQR
jgi:hypothetical protein